MPSMSQRARISPATSVEMSFIQCSSVLNEITLIGIVEAAGDELADRRFEIASLDADFSRLVAAIDHHEQGLVCAIGHDRGWYASFKHLEGSRLGFRSR